MRVRLLLFASAREAAGISETLLDAPDDATASQLVPLAVQRFPALAPLSGSLSVAVNQRYATPETALAEGDECALIPPISGG